MIIGKYSQMFDALAFAEGLKRAIRGVVKVSTGNLFSSDPAAFTQTCTGWLITDTLVVVPDYAIDITKKIVCQHHEMEGGQIEAVLASGTPASQTSQSPEEVGRPLLLRLMKPMPEVVLNLETKIPTPGDGVCVLQYAGYAPNPQVSTGFITNFNDTWVAYNADTLTGSGGAPVINIRTWNVIGMHMLGAKDDEENRGLRLDPLLDHLRNTPHWKEIAAYHQIADLSTTPATPTPKAAAPSFSDAVIEAALSWNFKADAFKEEDRNQLQPLVVSTRSNTWTLKTEERRRILQSAGTLENLRQKKYPAENIHPGQSAINRILAGPPFELEQINETELPYWLQAVRWFSNIVPGIPSAADIETAIEKRNIRSRLDKIITGFKGRKYELGELKTWYEDNDAGPLVLSGVGGIGKSALVAYFIHSLPDDCLFIWLDFDRVDLVADDAISILKAILEQAAVQITGLSKSEINFSDDWEAGAKLLGERIAAATKDASNPIIILDGFEIAQRVKEYQDVWKVLNKLMASAPKLKVIISGRAPVRSLKLGGKDAQVIYLKGLQPDDSLSWLHANDVSDENSVNEIMQIAEGIPLRLKLAVQYLRQGDDTRKLDTVSKAVIDGYLYTRILDRIIDPNLDQLVKDLLLLRKCSAKIIDELFSSLLPPKTTADEAYQQLSREMALVDEKDTSLVMSDTLELRPEVRTATLRLLEMENLTHVQEVDRKMAGWYRKQNLAEIANVTELIYHLLRSGQLGEAKTHWRFECSQFLKYAVDDLPESAHAEREWLSQQVDAGVTAEDNNLTAWEADIANDLRDRFLRGVVHGLDEILSSKKQRSDESPLLIYDAWNCWKNGHAEEGLKLLDHAKPLQGPVQYSRHIMNAFLTAKLGGFERADSILQEIENRPDLGMLADAHLEKMAVRAARVRLMVDIGAEMELFEDIMNNKNRVAESRQFLTQSDLVTPLLNDLFKKQSLQESSSFVHSIPVDPVQLNDFSKGLQQSRSWQAPEVISLEADISFTELLQNVSNNKAGKLAYTGYRRWRMATSDMMLNDFVNLLQDANEVIDPLRLSIINTLAAFRGEMIAVPSQRNAFIDRVLHSMVRRYKLFPPPPDEGRVNLLERYSQLNKQYSYSNDLLEQFIETQRNSPSPSFSMLAKMESSDLVSLVLYLFGPDPLEMLLKPILGFNDNAKLV